MVFYIGSDIPPDPRVRASRYSSLRGRYIAGLVFKLAGYRAKVRFLVSGSIGLDSRENRLTWRSAIIMFNVYILQFKTCRDFMCVSIGLKFNALRISPLSQFKLSFRSVLNVSIGAIKIHDVDS